MAGDGQRTDEFSELGDAVAQVSKITLCLCDIFIDGDGFVEHSFPLVIEPEVVHNVFHGIVQGAFSELFESEVK